MIYGGFGGQDLVAENWPRSTPFWAENEIVGVALPTTPSGGQNLWRAVVDVLSTWTRLL